MQLLLYGSRDFAWTVAELLRHCGHETAGMIDDNNARLDIVGTLLTRYHNTVQLCCTSDIEIRVDERTWRQTASMSGS